MPLSAAKGQTVPEPGSNVYPIDALAHSAATNPSLLQLHQVVLQSNADPEVPGEMTARHWVGVSIVRDEASEALRAAADWMDHHKDMAVDGIALERHYQGDGKELNEIRIFVDFQ